MTALKAIITLSYICDGDKKPNHIREIYTLEDMIFIGTIVELGDKGVVDITFLNKDY